MARDLPGSVVNSMRVLGLIVATSAVITLLIWLMRDDVILGFALLVLVLGSFFVGGHGWTRPVLTATAGVGVLVGVVCLDSHLPAIFVLLSALVIVEGVALLFFLWQRETTVYLRGA